MKHQVKYWHPLQLSLKSYIMVNVCDFREALIDYQLKGPLLEICVLINILFSEHLMEGDIYFTVAFTRYEVSDQE